MTHYSIKTRDLILVKSYGFLSFDKNMRKNFGKFISKALSHESSPGC